MKTEYYGLTTDQMMALWQAHSVLGLLGKLTADVVAMAQIDADESATVALLGYERLQGVLHDLGGPAPPVFYAPVPVTETETEGDGDAR